MNQYEYYNSASHTWLALLSNLGIECHVSFLWDYLSININLEQNLEQNLMFSRLKVTAANVWTLAEFLLVYLHLPSDWTKIISISRVWKTQIKTNKKDLIIKILLVWKTQILIFLKYFSFFNSLKISLVWQTQTIINKNIVYTPKYLIGI